MEILPHVGGGYFLATRYCQLNGPSVYFGLRRVVGQKIIIGNIFFSGIYNGVTSGQICPVVSLGANIKISAEGGTAENPRAIGR